MRTTKKMGILALICAVLCLSLISCTSGNEANDGSGMTRNSTATDYNPDGTNNYGQVNTNNGNTDGGNGDNYGDTDMNLNGVAGEIADSARNMVDGAARSAQDMSNSVERNNGVTAKNASGNTAGYYYP